MHNKINVWGCTEILPSKLSVFKLGNYSVNFRKKVMHWLLFHVWVVENQSQCHCSESITRNVQHKGLWEEAYLKKIYHKLKFTLSKMAVMQLFKT